MKISTKGRYTLRMMIDLAQNQNDGFVSLKDISERQDISKKYLEQIVPVLNKAVMVKANRGYQGGYMLAKAPKEYTLREILRLAEGSLAPVACLDFDVNDCPRADKCATLPVWQGLYDIVNNYLESITLQDIIDNSSKMDNSIDYVI